MFSDKDREALEEFDGVWNSFVNEIISVYVQIFVWLNNRLPK